MSNPIQKVLASEQASQERIERAREEAEALVAEAQRRARAIVERSEKRTQSAVIRYERSRTRAITENIHRLRKERRHQLRSSISRIDARLDDIVEGVVERFWPREADNAGPGIVRRRG